MHLRYTLLAEGSSDRALRFVLDWVLRQNTSRNFSGHWADLRLCTPRPSGLQAKVSMALQLFPCDILFVHRDGDKAGREARVKEIRKAVGEMCCVSVVPVRAQETWLLFNEDAIRHAAGRPAGLAKLGLPAMSTLEATADPKKVLRQALLAAAETSGRRKRKFRVSERAHRLAGLIEDYRPLRQLSAFAAFERELKQLLQSKGWS